MIADNAIDSTYATGLLRSRRSLMPYLYIAKHFIVVDSTLNRKRAAKVS